MALDDRHPTWATSNRFMPRTFVRPLLRFTEAEAASGILLLVAAAVALIWANSPWSESYLELFQQTRLELAFGPVHLDESLGQLINDGLMVIFFFVVGLEIKRELVLGDLRDPKAAALPVIAALGGMVVPAIIYTSVTISLGPEAVGGWGVPMATDIAFVVGVVALLGDRVPPGAKLFILAVAIADDIGAIIVIALFYSSSLSLGWLIAASLGLLFIWGAQRARIRSLAFYLPVAVAVWYATLESGVHATLSGVVIGFLTPARALYSTTEFETKARMILDSFPIGSTVRDEEKADYEAAVLTEIATESIAPLNRLEMRLLPWSSFVIVPLFALANAGVHFSAGGVATPDLARVAVGVATALFVGKTVGITLFSWLAVRTGVGRLPAGTGWAHVVGLAATAGIGFTVALFVTSLAFSAEKLADAAKVGIFAGSVVSGIVGATILWRLRPVVLESGAMDETELRA
jgi:NhaA family Na+:H+ antiporter